MPSKTLTVDEKDEMEKAIKLDQEIESLLMDFIPLGIKLMEMRDSRMYRRLENPETGEPFATFEEYCREKRGIAKAQAERVIRGSLVAGLLAGPPKGGPGFPRIDDETIVPTREAQVRLLADAQVPQFEYEDRSAEVGRNYKVPVAVANPDEVRKVWGQVAKQYKEAFEGAKEKKPKLNTTFIAKHLPDKYKIKLANHPVMRMRTDKSSMVIRDTGRLVELIEKSGLADFEKFKTLVEQEGWSKDRLLGARHAFKEIENVINKVRDCLGRIRI